MCSFGMYIKVGEEEGLEEVKAEEILKEETLPDVEIL